MSSLPPASAPETAQKPAEPVLRSFWSALALAWELGYLIAIPAFVLGGGGAVLDKHYGTSPWLSIAGFAIALTLSGISVVRRVKAILQ